MNNLEQWKRALLTLPEEPFFTLIKTYLGAVKTPFHKPSLIEDLICFLSKPDTKASILSRINRADAEILTALAALEDPDIPSLADFFKGSRSFFTLRAQLSNLEERLLIFLDRNSGRNRMRLNPLLQEDLLNHIIDSNLLFSSSPLKALPKCNEPWLTEAFVLAFLSLLQKGELRINKDSSFRQTSNRALKDYLPALFIPGRTERPGLLLKTLKDLDLIRIEGGNLQLNKRSLEEASKISKRDRHLLLWAAAWNTPLEIPRRAVILDSFLSSLDRERGYRLPDLERIAKAVSVKAAMEIQKPEEFLNTLISLDLLVPDENEGFTCNPAVGDLLQESQKPVEQDLIKLLPNFELTVKKETPFPMVRQIMLFGEIKSFDTLSLYRISKESVFRFFKQGLSRKDLTDLLQELTGLPVPQNIEYSLSQWEREYQSIRIVEGTVLLVEKERRYLVEHSAEFSTLLDQILAPGIYLLKPLGRERIKKALQSLGIEELPKIEKAGDTQTSQDSRFPETSGLAGPPLPSLPSPLPLPDSPRPFSIKALKSRLEELNLSQEKRADLENKINRGIIIFPEQISFVPQDKEKLEAKGIDYSGKVRLIQQALTSREDLLEIVERKANGDPRQLLVRPQGLERTGKELYLFGQTLPEKETIRVRVDKLSMVRRIKGSPFFYES